MNTRERCVFLLQRRRAPRHHEGREDVEHVSDLRRIVGGAGGQKGQGRAEEVVVQACALLSSVTVRSSTFLCRRHSESALVRFGDEG